MRKSSPLKGSTPRQRESDPDKLLIAQLREQITKVLEDRTALQRAIQIIEEMIHASPPRKK